MLLTSDPVALKAAVAELSGIDRVIAYLAERHGHPVLDRSSLVDFAIDTESDVLDSLEDRLFSELVDIVVHQQLAGKAAVAISTRVKDALGGGLTPKAVISSSPEVLRSAGLSGAKIAAITELARLITDGKISLSSLVELSDEQVISRICELRGFGPWSAEMFLMFSLRRMDVWPAGDLGVRKGYAHSYGLDVTPTPKELTHLGERFRPYRSVVAWYMWRSLSEPVPDFIC